MSRLGVGRVEWLDIRAVWPNEAVDFTPWLLVNVDVLRDALGGLDLELETAEHPVGTFSLDLVGTDLTHGTKLIVENQIERSDHRHLGQLLTYTAGTDAGTIIWIATAFHEEHRQALDWLNEHTDEGTRFFGVAVRALRVGNSMPAPFLEVVAKPNDWQKSVRRATSATGESSENIAYRSFWAPLRDRFRTEAPELVKGRAKPKSRWLTLNSPIAHTFIVGEIGSGELRVYLEIDTGDKQQNVALMNDLEKHRNHLETEAGDLDFVAGKRRCKVVRRLAWDGQLLTQDDRHDEARAWFDDSLKRLMRGVSEVAPLLERDDDDSQRSDEPIQR